MQRTYHPLHIAAQVALCGFCGFATASEYQQAHAVFLFGQRCFKFAVPLANIDQRGTGSGGPFAQSVQEDAALLASILGAGLVFGGELGQQIFLGVNADGTAVIFARSLLGVAVDDVQNSSGASIRRAAHAA